VQENPNFPDNARNFSLGWIKEGLKPRSLTRDISWGIPAPFDGAEGKTIYVKLSATGKTYNGRIYAVEPKIDQNTRTVQARALIPNDKSELTPGAYVEIDIVLENLDQSILIPTEALVPDFEGEKVFIYKNGKAVPQLVSPGIRTEKEIQITSGLGIGDSLIVSGIIQLKPNGTVRINKVY